MTAGVNAHLFHGLTEAEPPFASVAIDVTRVDPASEDHVARRWRALHDDLAGQGAPAELLEALRDAARAETGRGGDWTKILVGGHGRILLDLDVPGRPVRDEATWGPVPCLMPAFRGLAGDLSYVLVRIDRTGADVETVPGMSNPEAASSRETVEGDHDVVHSVQGGGTSQRRLQGRAEDSWERNAEAVADELDRIVRAARPSLVLVMGDVRATSLLERYASGAVSELLVRLDTGGRAAGTSETVEHEAIAEALAAHRAGEESDLVGRFVEQLTRQQAAVEGRSDVLEVLARGQADELLIVDDPASEVTVDVTSAGDVAEGGSEDATAVRADAALVWGAVRTRARVTLVDPHQVTPRDGVGALLRWSDQTTPHSAAPSMPGHGEPPGVSGEE